MYKNVTPSQNNIGTKMKTTSSRRFVTFPFDPFGGLRFGSDVTKMYYEKQ